jgi:glycosyltransferase involved in cell wall biosynthesis
VVLAKHLTAGGIDTLLVCGHVEPHEGDMGYVAREQGVSPLFLKELGREIMPLADVSSLVALGRVVREFRPHIIHTHTAKAGALGRLAGLLWNLTHAQAERIRLVHTFHGHVFHSYFGRFKTRAFLAIERFLARFTDRIVVISPAQKDDICRRYRIAPPGKVAMVPLGFDLTPFTEGGGAETKRSARRALMGDDRADGLFLVGFVGRLAPVKDPWMLVSAVKALEDEGLGGRFGFAVVGDGELRGKLEQEAARLGLAGRVRFTGWRREMPPVYRAMDAVVLTSLNEGTPVSLIEAMAAGLPVAATDVGGVPDLLGKVEKDLGRGVRLAERGLLIPQRDHGALARALAFLADHHGDLTGMRTRAARFAVTTYGIARHVKDMTSLYGELS